MYENKIKQIDILKNEISQLRPLSQREIIKLKEYYKIGLTYTSNALEGNFLTESETKIVIEDGITIGGKSLKDHYEVVGHAQAYDFLYKLVNKKNIEEKDILELHRLFYYRIDELNAGKYRQEQVYISGTDFLPPKPEAVFGLMKDFIQNIIKLEKELHPIEFAAKFHLDFVTIHPFIDGNGRCARLLMNLVLLRFGYVITIIPAILRHDYIEAIKKSQKMKADKPFVDFISCMVYESMKDYLRLVK